MKRRSVELPSRYLEPRIHPESHDEIRPFIEILSGKVSYNTVNDVVQGRKYLPAIRSQGANFGSPRYPRFAQDEGDIYLVRARIMGEHKKLPRITVGTFATAGNTTFVNVPLGSSYPNSRYDQRGELSTRDKIEDIAKAIFGVINNLPPEVSGSFFDAYTADIIELRRLQEPFVKAAQKHIMPSQPE